MSDHSAWWAAAARPRCPGHPGVLERPWSSECIRRYLGLVMWYKFTHGTQGSLWDATTGNGTM